MRNISLVDGTGHRSGLGRVLLLGAVTDRALVGDAVQAAGATIIEERDWESFPAPEDSAPDLIVASVDSAPPDILSDLLDTLVPFAATASGRLIVTLREDQIDPVAVALFDAKAELLCDPDATTLATAITLALVRADVELRGGLRDIDAERLRRLNEEVARIVELLARLTRDDDRKPGGVADPGRDYRGPPASVRVSPADVRRAIRARRLRDQLFADGLFEDPAWDMLLDLYAAELEEGQVSVSSLCIAAAVPATTALRWIGRMTEGGLLDRRPDEFDRRRAFVILTRGARESMDRYFALLAQNGIAIA